MENILEVRAGPGKPVFLGRQGENLARRIVFDLSAMREAYGDGSAQLVVRRSGDAFPYPAANVRLADGALIWSPSAADTARAGCGSCELRWYAGETLLKSELWTTLTVPALGELGQAPEAGTGSTTPADDPEGGLNDAVKQALLMLARKAAYADESGQLCYRALHDALYPSAALASIDAVFTQGAATICDTDTLDSLRQYLVVTGTYDDATTCAITDYVLSGTLTAGTSTVTVTYEGKTDTFTVTVTHYQATLDTVVYENKSYRDIFITANQLQGFDFENGLPGGCTSNAGSPSLSTDDAYSGTHALKAFGSTSTQYKSVNTAGVADWNKYADKQYFSAFKAKCTRYTKGSLGLSISNSPFQDSVTAVTDGWITKHRYTTTTAGKSASSAYIGSYASADLDGYIDDIVIINMTDLFTAIPAEADILGWYNDYCDLRKAGAV